MVQTTSIPAVGSVAAMPDETPTVPGTPVLVNFRKWDGREHWQEPTTYLGTDEHGVWLGMRRGTTFHRPGYEVVSQADSVKLASYGGWFATFNGPGHQIQTYVDITTIGDWSRSADGFVFTLVDLDLDIVREHDGRVFVDDEDEFADHQKLFGYPDDVIQTAERDCAYVFEAVGARAEPFAGRPDDWMAQLLADV